MPNMSGSNWSKQCIMLIQLAAAITLVGLIQLAAAITLVDLLHFLDQRPTLNGQS